MTTRREALFGSLLAAASATYAADAAAQSTPAIAEGIPQDLQPIRANRRRTEPLPELNFGRVQIAATDKTPAHRRYYAWFREGGVRRGVFLGKGVSNLRGVQLVRIDDRLLAPCGYYSDTVTDSTESWRHFFLPIAKAEGDYFGAANTYDTVRITLGPFQFAGHSSYLRTLLREIKEESACALYWPRLRAMSAVNYGTITEAFNRNNERIERDELDAIARFLIWSTEASVVKQKQYEIMRQTTLRNIGEFVRSKKIGKQTVMDKRDAWACVLLAADALHHGRDNFIHTAYKSPWTLAVMCTMSDSQSEADRIRAVLEQHRLQTANPAFGAVSTRERFSAMLDEAIETA